MEMGSLIIDLEGIIISPLERDFLLHPAVGGVILFARNYASRDQLKSLCNSIRMVRSAPILIMVDQEGGRVQRFVSEFTQISPMANFGKLYDVYPEQACFATRECGKVLAQELLSAGLDLTLAPVVDLRKNNHSVIGDRAFHANPIIVAQLAYSLILGMSIVGMAATAKHFPGHGSVTLDSHTSLPVDERLLHEVESEDLQPFIYLIQNNLQAIMTAHILFPNIDSQPVTFSHFWLQEILRKKMGFTGAIFSDDLNMAGANISLNYGDRVTASREAGCDFALLCNNPQGVAQALDQLNPKLYRSDRARADLLFPRSLKKDIVNA